MTYTIEMIKNNLSTNQKWVEGAIVKLYEFQTADEQKSEYTTNKNNVGFNAFDAKTLTYYAKWILSGKHLSGDHLNKAFSMMPKYARQILDCIEGKTKVVSVDCDYSNNNYHCDEEANCMLQN